MKILKLFIASIILAATAFAATAKTTNFTLNIQNDLTQQYAYVWNYPQTATIDKGNIKIMTLGGPTWSGHTWQAIELPLGVGNTAADQYKPCALTMAWADAKIINGAVAQQACYLALTIELNAQADVDNFIANLNANPDTDPQTNQIIVSVANLALKDVKYYPNSFYKQFTLYAGTGVDDYGITAGFGDGAKGWNNFLGRKRDED